MKLSEKIQEALREQQEINLSDSAVQKQLAALWGYVPAEAQPAPSVPEVTDAMALAFHRALTDGSIGAQEVEEIKDALRAALAAAPWAKP